MATIISHPAIPIALSLGINFGYQQKFISSKLLIVGIIAAVFPDIDVLSFKLGISYASPFAHRGITHSIIFATFFSMLLTLVFTQFRLNWQIFFKAYLFILFCYLSHSLLDMLTTGGLGVALFYPLDQTRYFFPTQVIKVSPFASGFF